MILGTGLGTEEMFEHGWAGWKVIGKEIADEIVVGR